jgi:carboxylate-amine ligase
VRTLIDTDTILDEGMIYFDARLAREYPTVELRVPDVCLHAEDAALLGVLARAPVDTSARDWAAEQPALQVRTELLTLANWRASRSGLEDALIHPNIGRPAPAAGVIDALFDHLRPSLEDAGEADEIRRRLDELLRRGNGASLQRAAHRRRNRLADIVADAVDRTSAE